MKIECPYCQNNTSIELLEVQLLDILLKMLSIKYDIVRNLNIK